MIRIKRRENEDAGAIADTAADVGRIRNDYTIPSARISFIMAIPVERYLFLWIII